MTNPDDTFRVTAKNGSALFVVTDPDVEKQIWTFWANAQDWSIGVVPADAPKKKTEE